MSKVEQTRNGAAIQGLWEEIGRIKEQQAAAEKMAALVGMTPDESMQYRDRHGRIKELTKELVALDGSITGGSLLMTKKEAKEITRHGRKGAQPHRSKRARKARISVEEVDDLYREIRVENTLTDEDGKKVNLKPGAKVDVIIEADTDATTKETE